jgi:hypothetical protein
MSSVSPRSRFATADNDKSTANSLVFGGKILKRLDLLRRQVAFEGKAGQL